MRLPESSAEPLIEQITATTSAFALLLIFTTKSVYPVCGILEKVTLDAPAAPTEIFSIKT
jgi:hypothetical protein